MRYSAAVNVARGNAGGRQTPTDGLLSLSPWMAVVVDPTSEKRSVVCYREFPSSQATTPTCRARSCRARVDQSQSCSQRSSYVYDNDALAGPPRWARIGHSETGGSSHRVRVSIQT